MQMRRKDRAVTDRAGILEILERCKVCRLGLCDDEGMYIVPLNFGFLYGEDGELRLVFHGAKTGRKLDAIQKNARVVFEMDCDHQLHEGEIACRHSYAFGSIFGQGEARILQDTDEKAQALALLMRHQTGRDFTFDEKMMEAVAVFEVKSRSFCAKRHL